MGSNQMFGVIAPIMPALIAVSALGGLSCHIMTSSRLCFVGARNGHFPDCLSLVTASHLTPPPALVFLAVLSLLYLRYTRPDMHRPIKISLVVPITFLLICTFLVFLPLYVRPLEVGMGLLITAAGVPVYMAAIRWRDKPKWFQEFLYSLGYCSQKMFMGLKEDKDD